MIKLYEGDFKPLTIEEIQANIKNKADRANAEIGNLNIQDGLDCSICHNKGFIYVPSSDGLMLETTPCECMKKRKSIRYIKDSGMGDLLNYRIGNFIATEDWQKTVKEIALDYVKNNKDNWFTFLGHSGIGKTMICSAIANNYVRNLGIETKYIIWNDFIDKVKDFDSDIFQEIKNVPVLYIDDLLKGKVTDWQREVFFKLINHRYNNKLITIISSEYSYEKLAELDEAIASRIYQMSGKYFIEQLGGENYRTKGK